MKDPLNRIKDLLWLPTKPKWRKCWDIVNILKDLAPTHPPLWTTIDECVAFLRTWYLKRAEIQGYEHTRKFYGPEEDSYFAWRCMLHKAGPRPSIQPPPKGPLPAADSDECMHFLSCFNTTAATRAVFAGLYYHRTSLPLICIFGIPFRGGAVCGVLLREAYQSGSIPRAGWALEPLAPEAALIEDLVLFQIIKSPGLRTKTLVRLAPSANAFLHTMTQEQTYAAIRSAILRLERYGRIHQVRRNRWELTQAGRMAVWADLPKAWEKFTAFGKRPRSKAPT